MREGTRSIGDVMSELNMRLAAHEALTAPTKGFGYIDGMAVDIIGEGITYYWVRRPDGSKFADGSYGICVPQESVKQ